MRLRFVTCNDAVSELIRYREGDMAKWVGFTPTHVEIAVPGGYLGAHYDGGVAIRPIGYDKAKLAHELFVDVTLPDEEDADKWARAKIGSPYDWKAILEFILDTPLHEHKALICSAFCTGALDAGGKFIYPLAKAWHQISPSDLLFWLSGHRHIAR